MDSCRGEVPGCDKKQGKERDLILSEELGRHILLPGPTVCQLARTSIITLLFHQVLLHICNVVSSYDQVDRGWLAGWLVNATESLTSYLQNFASKALFFLRWKRVQGKTPEN